MSVVFQMADLQQEHHREIEGLLENIRQLSRELRLQMLIIDNFIPQEYQEMIENYVHWNEDIGEWQLKCVAYTGNNMRKQTPVSDKKEKDPFEVDLSHVYLAYTEESMRQSLMKLERPRTSKSGKSRPKTARSYANSDMTVKTFSEIMRRLERLKKRPFNAISISEPIQTPRDVKNACECKKIFAERLKHFLNTVIDSKVEPQTLLVSIRDNLQHFSLMDDGKDNCNFKTHNPKKLASDDFKKLIQDNIDFIQNWNAHCKPKH
ncbi:hypothetical protein cypCar_00019649 [Cyprinus carpio]|nr:hypothetical protein cypCar_00019649 [Cyprinus carpio]